MAWGSVVLALVLTAMGVSGANAMPNHGWYASVELGADWSSVTGRVTDLPLGGLLNLDHGPFVDTDSTMNLDTGWAGFAAAGLMTGPHFGFESALGFTNC